jgi:hypothetical protein
MRETSRITVDDIGHRIILLAHHSLKFWGTSNFLLAGDPPKYLSENPRVATIDARRHPDFKAELARLSLSTYQSVTAHPDDRRKSRFNGYTSTRVGDHYIETYQYLYVMRHYEGVTWWVSPTLGKIMAVSKGYPVAWLTPTPPSLLVQD